MIRFFAAALAASAAACLPAQFTVDTVGGTTSTGLRTNSGKASLYGVNSSVLLMDFEWWLDVPTTQTVTFFAHRHHSRAGTAQLIWTHQVTLTGGGGPSWHSSGPIALPLLAGNHYTLGLSWAGSLSYYYSTAATGSPVSFGTWQRAHTVTNPPPATLSIPTGVDGAQYHQRLSTVPLPAPNLVGTGCAPNLVPRLVATGLFGIGTQESFELVDAAPSSFGAFVIAIGPTLPVAIPLFGCDVWVNLGAAATNTVITSAAGYAAQPFPVPNVPAFLGLQISAQGAVLGAGIDMTNAINITIG